MQMNETTCPSLRASCFVHLHNPSLFPICFVRSRNLFVTQVKNCKSTIVPLVTCSGILTEIRKYFTICITFDFPYLLTTCISTSCLGRRHAYYVASIHRTVRWANLSEAKLRAARLARRYTQSQLAAPDFSVSYISAIERGQIHPSLRALEILARRLDLNSSHLLPDRSQPGNGVPAPSLSRDGDEMDLVLIEGQIAILQGNAQQAIHRLSRLPHKGMKPQLLLRQGLLLGWAYLLTDQLPASEQSLLDVEKHAKEQHNTPTLLHALYLLGQVYTAMYNHEQAQQGYERCLAEMEHAVPLDPFLQSQVYNLLGQEYAALEQSDMAIEKFKQAIAIAEELTDVTYLKTVYQEICTHYANTQEYLLATIYAHKCLHLQRQNILPLKREIYHNLGRAMMKKIRRRLALIWSRYFCRRALYRIRSLRQV